jgi:hypothetical protein
MAENDGGCIAGAIITVIVIAAVAHSCDHPTGYSPGGSSSGSTAGSNAELIEAVDDAERARRKLAEVAFDETRRAQYLDALDAELDRMDYDFNGWMLLGEEKSKTRFRDMLVEACRSRGIAPPESLSRLGAPFDKSKVTIDWGNSSNSSQLPDGVRRWIAQQGETVDPLRQEVARLNAQEIVASKTLALTALRQELQGKLRDARMLLRTFESEIDEIEQNVRKKRTEKKIATARAAMGVPAIRSDLELLLSKRAHVRYLRTLIDALEGATTDLQFLETKSHDEFKITKLAGVEESRRLVEKIDLALTKYRGPALDRKPEAGIDETPEDIWQEIQRPETTTT